MSETHGINACYLFKALRQKVSCKVSEFQMVAPNTVSGKIKMVAPELLFGGDFKETLR